MTTGSARHRRAVTRTRPDRRRDTNLLLVGLLTGACGALTWVTGTYPPAPAPMPSPVAMVQPAVGHPDDGAVPVRIDILDIGLSADVESLVRFGDGTLATPRAWNDAGWYAEGVAPGESGPAIIVGHRDSAANGPAVFYRLGELTPGSDVTVTERDGGTNHFVVQSLQQVAKEDFPTDQLYGPSAHRLLRLITCTGDFDFDAGSYLDNLVVTARAV